MARHKPDQPEFDSFMWSLLASQEQQDPATQAATEPAHDLHLSGLNHSENAGVRGHIVFGRVIYMLPKLNWYRVQVDDGGGDLPCSLLTDCNHSPLGPRHSGALSPGETVWVYKHPRALTGVILGSAPEILQDGNQSYGDWISQGGGSGLYRAGYYNQFFSIFEQDGGAIDWSADRPNDQTCLDWGRITELGGRIHIDPFLIQLAIDETCGVFAHYHDSYLRIAGYNQDQTSAAHLDRVRDDNGELQIFRGECLYPWEMYGAFGSSASVSRTVSASDVIYDQPYGTFEPATDDQQPFFRFREWGGYLAQGYSREVVLPDAAASVNKLADADTPLTGVFREQVLPDGTYLLQSAKSVVIAKRTPIPVARQSQLPEDYSDNADKPVDYSKQKVGDVSSDATTATQLLTPAAVLDLHAYFFNWKGIHPFHYHPKDYRLPEEGALKLSQVQQQLDFTALTSQQDLTQPQPITIRVDDRYNQVRYYQVLSHISLLDDGSVVTQGGGGCSMTFAGGSITFDCPGDINLRPGRSLVVLGGDDIVLRAHNSLDLSAATKDLRIKAEKNLHMLGGNSGDGGVLIESLASGELNFENVQGEDVSGNGLILKSSAGPLSVLAGGIYLRTGSEDGQVLGGPIVLDADKGQKPIITVSETFDRYVTDAFHDVFGIDEVQSVNKYEADRTRLGSGLDVDGQVAINGGGLFVKGGISVIEGHIGTEYAASFEGLVGDLQQDPASLQQARVRLQQVDTDQQQAQKTATQDYQDDVVEQYYADGKIGNGDTESMVGFSFRSVSQYGTQDYKLVAPFWQQLAGDQASGLPTWTEPPVQVGEKPTMPYPGYEQWAESSTFYQYTSTLYNPSTGRDNDRGDGSYETAKLGDWQTSVPDGKYPVIR